MEKRHPARVSIAGFADTIYGSAVCLSLVPSGAVSRDDLYKKAGIDLTSFDKL